MAKRFTGGYYSREGIEYDIEIYDSAFSGTATAFNVTEEGVVIQYEGDPSDYVPVRGSRATFNIILESSNTTELEQLMTDILTAPEAQLQVLVKRSGSTYWFGNILSDISVQEDRSPSIFTITATDGLGALNSVDYNNSGTKYTGKETIIQHLVKSLGKIGTLDTFFTSGIHAITTVGNWYEDDHTTGAAEDPFAKTRLDHSAFYEIDNKGFTKYQSTYSVLSKLAERFLCTCYLSGGVFRFEQWTERDNSSHRERLYDKDGTYLSNTLTSYNVTLDQSLSKFRAGGGSFDWLPALSRVRETFHNRIRYNHLAGQSFTNSSNAPVTSDVEVNSSGSTVLQLTGIHSRTLTVSAGYPGNGEIYAIFDVKIQVGSYYLKRNILQINNGSITYESATWTTSSGSKYQIAYDYSGYNFPGSAGGSITMPGVISVTTPPLPGGGSLTTEIDFFNHRKKSDGSIVDPSYFSLTWSFSNLALQVYTNGNPAEITDDTIYTADNPTTGFTATKDFEAILGDAGDTNDVGKLEVKDSGGFWTDSDQWRVGTTGTFYAISDLLLDQYLAWRKKAVRRYTGTLSGTSIHAHTRVTFDGNNWLLLNGTFKTGFDTWEGTWAAVSVDNTGIIHGTATGISINDAPFTPPIVGLIGGGQTPSTSNPAAAVINAISSATTDSDISTGTITSIRVNEALSDNAFTQGDVIAILNPANGQTTYVTVTDDVDDGDTSISVTGYASTDIPAGSAIIYLPQNDSTTSYGSSGSSSSTTINLNDLDELFKQIFRRDDTNEQNYRIEIPDIVLETDENAGDGSTAGIRYDGSGIKAYKSSSSAIYAGIGADGSAYFRDVSIEDDPNAGDGSTAGIRLDTTNGLNAYKSTSATATASILPTGVWDFRTQGATGVTATGVILGSDSGIRAFKSASTTPTFYLKTTGELLFNHNGHPTVQTGIFYVNNGLLHMDHDGLGTKVHAQFGHIKDFQVIGFNTAWTTGIKSAFWRLTSQYAGYEVYKFGYSVGSTAGSGSGSNTCVVWHQDSTGTTTTNLGTLTCNTAAVANIQSASSVISLSQGDVFYFDVTGVRSTPAQGLFVEFYIRKT